MELLIVVGVLGILAAGLLAVIDPFEQLKKSRDATRRDIATNVYSAIINSMGTSGKFPWNGNYIGLQVNSTTGKTLTDLLIQRGELKSSFSATAGLTTNMYATALMNGSWVSVCFLPESKAMKSSEARYDTTGIPKENCDTQDCYVCVGSMQPVGGVIATGPTPTPTPGICDNFDPEYPKYAFTCNSSSKWSSYGCTNYCVADLGCGKGCPAGERRLAKTYYATQGHAVDTCLAGMTTTTEYYCVSGAEAGCSIKSFVSSPSDYNWGCTNPRRPSGWIQ